MGSFSIWHWLIVLAVAVVLFGGGGKLSRLMGDFGRGLREFKSSLEGDTKLGKGGSKGGSKSDDDAPSGAKKGKAKKSTAKSGSKKKS